MASLDLPPYGCCLLAAETHRFRDWLTIAGKSERTIQSYIESVGVLHSYLHATDRPTAPEAITGDDLIAFVRHLQTTTTTHRGVERALSASTVALRQRSIAQFFRYLIDQDVIDSDANPMRRVPAVRVPVPLIPTIEADQVKQVLDTCDRSFDGTRDEALLRMLFDNGARLAELADARLADLDLAVKTLRVLGKGNRERLVPFGPRTLLALNRYLRQRDRHRRRDEPWLWLGQDGHFTKSGISQMVRRRTLRALGVAYSPHKFRHGWASASLALGMQETDVMRIAGWRTRTMLERYGASAGDARARAAHARFSPGDLL